MYATDVNVRPQYEQDGHACMLENRSIFMEKQDSDEPGKTRGTHHVINFYRKNFNTTQMIDPDTYSMAR